MVAGTVYLDVDDEITSAAARIRSSESAKVGLVVPYGSRISTSRMNFRLLSREAVINNRRLSIVAADPATRALAASAGLPVFATVAEYESALAGPPPTIEDADAGEIGAAAPEGAASEASDAPPAAKGGPKKRARRGSSGDETQAVALPAAAAAAAPAVAAVGAGQVASAPLVSAPGASAPSSSFDRHQGEAGGIVGRIPVRGAAGRLAIRTPVLVGAIAVVLALAVVAVGAYLVLPAATITVTPRPEAIGPITLSVTANPKAPSVDPATATIPADELDVPLEVTDTFTTVGVRTELIAATGEVTFRNVDFTATNTIPAGSVVSTPNGVKFGTDKAVTVARATLVNLTVVPSFATVSVTAVKKGTAGNVEPNTITVIPPGEDPVTLTVRNQQPTAGGAKNDFPKISQAEVDQAVAALHTKLQDAFDAAVAAGAGASAATTLFPETAALGDATPSVDPATLVGQEVPTFDLGLSAHGTVIAVDASPVSQIAQARLLGNVGNGYQLVDGSVHIDQGTPVVTNGVVTFPVSARAARVQVLDPEALRALVKNKPIEDARAQLAPFGDVTIDTWPAWVSSITGFDSRLTVTVADGGGAGASPAAGGSVAPGSASPSAAP